MDWKMSEKDYGCGQDTTQYDMRCLPQSFIAKILNVSTVTIREWHKLGLPYVRGKKGKPNKYDFAVCACFSAGLKWAREDKLNLKGFELVVFNHLYHHLNDGETFSSYIKLGLILALRSNEPEQNALITIGRIYQILIDKYRM